MVCNKKIVYVDMDNVLVDFQSGIDAMQDVITSEYDGRIDEVPGIFAQMKPLPGVQLKHTAHYARNTTATSSVLLLGAIQPLPAISLLGSRSTSAMWLTSDSFSRTTRTSIVATILSTIVPTNAVPINLREK